MFCYLTHFVVDFYKGYMLLVGGVIYRLVSICILSSYVFFPPTLPGDMLLWIICNYLAFVRTVHSLTTTLNFTFDILGYVGLTCDMGTFWAYLWDWLLSLLWIEFCRCIFYTFYLK